jgi:hypothetical protein
MRRTNGDLAEGDLIRAAVYRGATVVEVTGGGIGGTCSSARARGISGSFSGGGTVGSGTADRQPTMSNSASKASDRARSFW